MPRGSLLHLWLGLTAGAVLCVVALTGVAYTFEADIRRAFSESIAPQPLESRAAPSALAAGIATAQPGVEVLWMIWPKRPDDAVWAKVKTPAGHEVSVMLDPYTGAPLPGATIWRSRFDQVLAIHRTLGLGEFGKKIVGTAALGLVILTVSGLLLSLPRTFSQWRRSYAVSGRARGVARAFSWHRAVGWWVAPIVTVSALTGLIWAFDWYRAIVDRVLRSPALPPAPVVTAVGGAGDRLGVDSVLESTRELRSDAAMMRIYFPRSSSQPWRVEWTPASRHFISQRSRAYIHPVTGAILRYQAFEENPIGERLSRLAYPLHTGLILGRPTQVLMSGGAAGLAGLFGTGLWLYVLRRRQAVLRHTTTVAANTELSTRTRS